MQISNPTTRLGWEGRGTPPVPGSVYNISQLQQKADSQSTARLPLLQTSQLLCLKMSTPQPMGFFCGRVEKKSFCSYVGFFEGAQVPKTQEVQERLHSTHQWVLKENLTLRSSIHTKISLLNPANSFFSPPRQAVNMYLQINTHTPYSFHYRASC